MGHGMPVFELLDPPGTEVTVSCDHPTPPPPPPCGCQEPTSGPLHEQQILFIFFLNF